MQYSLPRRSSSVPPTSTTRSVPSITQQGDYKPSRLDHVDSSSWPRWIGQPQISADLEESSVPAKSQPDSNETHQPEHHNSILSDQQSIYDSRIASMHLNRLLPLTIPRWSQIILNPDELWQQAALPGRNTFNEHTDSSFGVHQQMEDRQATPPLPTGSGNLDSLPEVSSMDDDDELDGTTLGAAIRAARTQLFVTLTRSRDAQAPKTATLNLATAQRLVLADAQRRLTQSCHEIHTVDKKEIAIDTLATLRELMNGYCM